MTMVAHASVRSTVRAPNPCSTPTMAVYNDGMLTIDTVIAALIQSMLEGDFVIMIGRAHLDPATGKSQLSAKELAIEMVPCNVRLHA